MYKFQVISDKVQSLYLVRLVQWDIEQWKYERGNELVFVNEASTKALQIKGDATYNASGDPQDPFC